MVCILTQFAEMPRCRDAEMQRCRDTEADLTQPIIFSNHSSLFLYFDSLLIKIHKTLFTNELDLLKLIIVQFTN